MSGIVLKSPTAQANLKFTGSFNRNLDISNGQIVAWVNFDGTTNVIREGFNVSSITDLGLGTFGITLTEALPNTNYVITGFVNDDSIAITDIYEWGDFTTYRTTSYFAIRTTAGTSLVDRSCVQLIVFI